jgi:hypothetical protein
MEIETKYGEFQVIETPTGLMVECIDTGAQFFIDGRWLPSIDNTMDVNLTIQAIEDEYEFQHDLN